jgi:hypothetical protein
MLRDKKTLTYPLCYLLLIKYKTEEIADGFDVGMKCYYNRLTRDIKLVIDFDSWIGIYN